MKLKAGIASKYFVTDAETMTCSIERPYLVLSKEELSVYSLAKILVMLNDKVKRMVFFNFGAKKYTVQECEIALNDVYEAKKSNVPLFDRALVIFAPVIGKKALVIMKVLKVRGTLEIFAIQSNESDLLNSIGKEVEAQQVVETSEFSVYGPVNFNIVSGIKETIVSPQNIKQISKDYPEIIVKGDVKDELFFEGLTPEPK